MIDKNSQATKTQATKTNEVSIDVNDVIEYLQQVISGQVLQIAKLEALNKRLMEKLQGLQAQEKQE